MDYEVQRQPGQNGQNGQVIASVPQDDLEIVLLARHQPRAWGLVPVVASRLKQFCARYDSDADADLLIQMYQQQFIQDDPHIIALVLLHSGIVVGHLLAALDNWMGCIVVTITQYEMDQDGPRIGREALLQAGVWLQAWGQAHGARHVQCLVRSPVLVTLFKELYGFMPFAMLLRQPVAQPENI